VKQQLSRPQGLVIHAVSLFIGADMTVEQPHFAPFDHAVALLQVDSTRSYGFDLGPEQGHAGLEDFKDVVLVESLSVQADHLLFGSVGGGILHKARRCSWEGYFRW
jgi:hypothetical protein